MNPHPNMKKWWDEHPEKKIEYSEQIKKWWAKHPNKKIEVSIRQKNWWNKHPDEKSKRSKSKKEWWDECAERKIEKSKLQKIWWKEHPEKVETQKIRFSGKNNPLYGKHLSEETKIKISKTNKERFKNNSESRKNNNHFSGKHHSLKTRKKMQKYHRDYFKTHSPTYPKAFFVKELGHGVRSSWEKEIGLLLKKNEIEYGYETKRFDLGNSIYIPDFEINPETFIEVKGFLLSKKRKKLLKFQKLYPQITLIGIGSGDENVFDIYIQWKDRENVVDIIKERCS